MNRLPSISSKDFTQAQQKLLENITSGKRAQQSATNTLTTPDGSLRGPFSAWLHSPILGDAAQRLGEAVRFESTIPPVLRELAILTVAAKWQAQYEWWAHEKIARREGLDDHIIKNLKTRTHPDFGDPTQAVVYTFAREVIDQQKVSDHHYKEAVEHLSETIVVELVILLGYYTLISMTLNVFEVPLPAGEQLPFSNPDQEHSES